MFALMFYHELTLIFTVCQDDGIMHKYVNVSDDVHK